MMSVQEVIQIDEGKYMIDVQTLKKETDEPSAMASYLSPSAIVTNQDDSLYLTVMFMDQKTIVGFQVENQTGEWVEAIDQQVNEEANSRYEMFNLDRLMSPLNVRVQYEIIHEGQKITGDEELRLAFEEESLEKLN